MTSKPFSPERLMKLRRLRKARRLYQQSPVFAFVLMQSEYPGYTLAQFCDDLRRRSKPRQRKTKTPLSRFGRYHRMLRLLRQYEETKDEALLIQAQQLQRHMTKPYRVLVRVAGDSIEYSLSPLIPVEQVEALVVKFKACRTEEDADAMFRQFQSETRYGN